MVQRIYRLIGRRGAALLWFAFLDLIICISLLDEDSRPKGTAVASYVVVVLVAPYSVWGVLWGVVGLVCAVQAFMHSDKVAFGVAISLKLLWGSCFLAAWVFHGAYRGWLSVAIWYSLAAFVAIIAGWPEPPDLDDHAANMRGGRRGRP